jgi:DNA modification methylase
MGWLKCDGRGLSTTDYNFLFQVIGYKFGGSGSTLIACEKTNRQARLMELDPKYCDVIVKRWQDFTGKKATHESSGRTFDEMKP